MKCCQNFMKMTHDIYNISQNEQHPNVIFKFIKWHERNYDTSQNIEHPNKMVFKVSWHGPWHMNQAKDIFVPIKFIKVFMKWPLMYNKCPKKWITFKFHELIHYKWPKLPFKWHGIQGFLKKPMHE